MSKTLILNQIIKIYNLSLKTGENPIKILEEAIEKAYDMGNQNGQIEAFEKANERLISK